MFPHLGMTYLARQQHSRQRRGMHPKPTLHQEEMAMAARLAFVIAASMATVGFIMWAAN